MLKQRILTALVLIPLVVWAILGLPTQWLAILLAVIVLGGAWEWSQMAGLGSNITRIIFVVCNAIAMFLLWQYIQEKDLYIWVLALALIHQFVALVEWLSALVGIRPTDHALKLALFHTCFNLLGVVVMLPFVGRLVTMLERLWRETPATRHSHLDSHVKMAPDPTATVRLADRHPHNGEVFVEVLKVADL